MAGHQVHLNSVLRCKDHLEEWDLKCSKDLLILALRCKDHLE
jgi:hypothetical protein